MVWQVVAMWVIVIVTITWFIRDERRLRSEAALARAARYYAHAPKYRHVATGGPALVPAPAPQVGGLSHAQRQAFKAMLR